MDMPVRPDPEFRGNAYTRTFVPTFTVAAGGEHESGVPITRDITAVEEHPFYTDHPTGFRLDGHATGVGLLTLRRQFMNRARQIMRVATEAFN